jgi:hypothetical protein
VSGFFDKSYAQAEALVRTSVMAVANQTHLDVYNANLDVISQIQWLSTLDLRTTTICQGLDSKTWDAKTYAPIGHSLPFPGPTAHWNCRSTQIPVTKSWEELATQNKAMAKQMDAIPDSTRASMDGQVAQKMTYEEFLQKLPEKQQMEVLGSKYDLWAKTKDLAVSDPARITLADMLDQKGNPLNLTEFADKAGYKLDHPDEIRAHIARLEEEARRIADEVVKSEKQTQDLKEAQAAVVNEKAEKTKELAAKTVSVNPWQDLENKMNALDKKILASKSVSEHTTLVAERDSLLLEQKAIEKAEREKMAAALRAHKDESFVMAPEAKAALELCQTKEMDAITDVENFLTHCEAMFPNRLDEIEQIREHLGTIDYYMWDNQDETKAFIRINFDSMNKVLKEGRFKTLFESGSSGGVNSTELRSKIEEMLFGYDKNLPENLRPVYGYVSDEATAGQFAQSYGDLEVKLSDAVKKRMSMTFYDSLDTGYTSIATTEKMGLAGGGFGDSEQYRRLFEDTKFPEMYKKDIDAKLLTLKTQAEKLAFSGDSMSEMFNTVGGMSEYVEAQFHGGLRVEDIESITLGMVRPNATSMMSSIVYDSVSQNDVLALFDSANAHGIELEMRSFEQTSSGYVPKMRKSLPSTGQAMLRFNFENFPQWEVMDSIDKVDAIDDLANWVLNRTL